jgi:hypothetical protein
MATGWETADHSGPGRRDGEWVAVALLLLFLCGWIATMLTIQFVQVAQNGYGSGVGDGNHVPTSIVSQIGVGSNLGSMIKASNRK